MKNHVIFHSKMTDKQKDNIKKNFIVHRYDSNLDYYFMYRYKRYLVNLNKDFSVQASKYLTSIVNKNVNINFLNVFVQSYEKFIYDKNFSKMIINYLNISSFQKIGFTSLSYNILLFIIEAIFGGVSDSMSLHQLLNKGLTIAEIHILETLHLVMLDRYSILWKKFFKFNIDFRYSKINFNLSNVNNQCINDFFLISIFQIKIGEILGSFSIACPFSIVSELNTRVNNVNNNVIGMKFDKNFLWSIINSNIITLRIKLNKSSLVLSDILKLKVGDVLSINFSNNIVAYFNKIPVLIGEYRIFKKQHVFLVKSFVN